LLRFFYLFSFEAQQQTRPEKLVGTPQVKLIGRVQAWVSPCTLLGFNSGPFFRGLGVSKWAISRIHCNLGWFLTFMKNLQFWFFDFVNTIWLWCYDKISKNHQVSWNNLQRTGGLEFRVSSWISSLNFWDSWLGHNWFFDFWEPLVKGQ